MATQKRIALSNLLVNIDNYRFEPVATQKDAIDKMVKDQRNNLYTLAEHIVQYGLNPNDKIQVVLSNQGNSKYNVVEGNRRIVALKLLTKPNLLKGEGLTTLKNRFIKLHNANKIKIIKSIDCVVYDDPNEAEVWIGIKHGYGKPEINTKTWDPIQKARYAEKTKGKPNITLQAIEFMNNSEYVPDTLKSKLKDLPFTHLERLLGDPNVKHFLGIKNNKGILESKIEKNEVAKGLAVIVQGIFQPNFIVDDIYTKDDRKTYLDSIPNDSKPNLNNKTSDIWQFTTQPIISSSNSYSSPVTSKKKKSTPKDRKYLIPSSCIMNISNPKVNSIYHELLKLDINQYTNSCSVTFRVFIELSIDCYIEKHKLTSSLSSAKSNTGFQTKVFQVANHLESKNLADTAICKMMKFAIKDNNDVLGIDTWHAYIHNNRFAPKSENLIITWDGIQEFMVILWNNIN